MQVQCPSACRLHGCTTSFPQPSLRFEDFTSQKYNPGGNPATEKWCSACPVANTSRRTTCPMLLYNKHSPGEVSVVGRASLTFVVAAAALGENVNSC